MYLAARKVWIAPDSNNTLPLTSCLDSAALLMLNELQFGLFGQILTSRTGGQPYSDIQLYMQAERVHCVLRHLRSHSKQLADMIRQKWLYSVALTSCLTYVRTPLRPCLLQNMDYLAPALHIGTKRSVPDSRQCWIHLCPLHWS